MRIAGKRKFLIFLLQALLILRTEDRPQPALH